MSEKSRVPVYVLISVCLSLASLFACLKIGGVIDWPWWIIASPLYAFLGAIVVTLVIMAVLIVVIEAFLGTIRIMRGR